MDNLLKQAKIKAFLFDLDGVLWRGQQRLPGIQPLLANIRAREIPLTLVTNNSTTLPAGIQIKAKQMEIDVTEDEIITSAFASIHFLQANYPANQRILVIGEQDLHTCLRTAGFPLTDDPFQADIVLVGMDRHLNWTKLTNAALAIQNGAIFIGTNGDRSYPMEKGIGIGTGAQLAAIEATTAVAPILIGKPEAAMFQMAARRMQTEPENILVFGDRLETDILGGNLAGMQTAVVLTGITTPAILSASDIQPDWVFADLIAANSSLFGEG